MGDDGRLPAALEVSALVRRVQAEGGFATVIAKGEPDAGTILLVLLERGRDARLYERMPLLTGGRAWQCVRRENPENPGSLDEFLTRRRGQDRDVWIVELDIPQAERFIGTTIAPG